ncbi:MAG TPA: phosphoribosylamine--glycine ligase [Ruminococcaceae bacterium]|nr:phosphoribosylamine--glycine ligase [Oscillospiraceae bacterium]
MKILMIGGGGREHALIKKLKECSRVSEIFCAPGNGGISRDAKCFPDINPCDIPAVIRLAKETNAETVFVAPDDPLAAGLVDALEAEGIRAFGPGKLASRIEASKVFSKNLMKNYGIPTAGYEIFDDAEKAVEYIIQQNKYPCVIKADGLALGKGVVIAEDFAAAKDAVEKMMKDKIFGESGSKVVIEEFLTGPEVSVLCFTDGKTVAPMISSMDHKPVFEGNKGPNTGGMGTVAPNPRYTPEIARRAMDEIFLPTVHAMREMGCPFKGCLYFGLMLTKDEPKVIEYNARFGDPETQVVLPLLETDLADIIDAVIDERLSEIDIVWKKEACACVVMASGGYPGSYPKGIPIGGLDENGQTNGSTVYHAGTRYENGEFLTNGGRVLGVTGIGSELKSALENAYSAVEKIHFDGAHYRKDIGRQALGED